MTPTPPGHPSRSTPNLRVDGDALRAKRTRKGLSITQLAGLVGVHRTYVGKIERGERPGVNPRIVDAMATTLGVRPTALVRRNPR